MVYCLAGLHGLETYADEQVYITCGLGYVVNFSAPYSCNFEHPPLGKYLIGFSVLFGFGRLLYLFLMFGSSLLVFVLVRRLLGSELLGFLACSFLVLDTVFLNSHRFLLLDPPALFFFLLSLYFLLVRSSLTASAVFYGLSVACKLSVAPYFAVLAYSIYSKFSSSLRRFLRCLMFFVCVAFFTYLVTYVADFRLGPYTIIQHHLDMLSYMSWRHGFSLPIAINGLMKLVSKVEVWRYGSNLTLVFSATNSSMVLINSTLTQGSGSYVYVGLGSGSVLWYLMIPSLIVNTYYVLSREPGFSEVIVCLAGWVSLTTVLPGPLDWYYVNTLPLMYANVALLTKHLTKNREDPLRKLVTVLLVIQFLVTALTLAGAIPYRTEFFLPR
ncbi:MAG: hypothetical protein ACP5KB_06060 [Thermoprotei archaeon]